MCESHAKPDLNHWHNNEGLVTLSPKATRLNTLLDQLFVQVADELAAESMLFPPLLKVGDVDHLDYFKNFPQLPLAVSSTQAKQMSEHRNQTAEQTWETLPVKTLAEAAHILPPAACYAVYIHHRDKNIGQIKVVTTAAKCYRNETHYIGLKRLKAFTMREIIFIGEMEAVTQHLSLARQRIQDIATALGLQTTLEQATDPFFDPNSARALTQKLFPTKQEIICDDLAIGSANFHRNFFGERFGITYGDAKTAFTACIGMGLERWIHSVLHATADDIDEALYRVSQCLGQTEATILLNPAIQQQEEMTNA